MTTSAPRLLLAFSALLLVVGGIAHAAAFHGASAAIGASNLGRFFGNSSKALWLSDSSNMFILAAIFSLIAARPSSAASPVVLLLALIPVATAVLIYVFLGAFFAGHLLLAAGATAFFAGLRLL